MSLANLEKAGVTLNDVRRLACSFTDACDDSAQNLETLILLETCTNAAAELRVVASAVGTNSVDTDDLKWVITRIADRLDHIGKCAEPAAVVLASGLGDTIRPGKVER